MSNGDVSGSLEPDVVKVTSPVLRGADGSDAVPPTRLAKRQVLKIAGVSHGNNPIPFGVKIGKMVFSGGISGQDPTTSSIPPEPARQAELIFQHMRTLVEQAGGTTDDIAHVTVFVKDMQHRELINAEWVKLFPDEENRPTRHTLVYDHLPGAAVMQIEMIAVLD